MNDCEDVIRPALESAIDSFDIESDDGSCRVIVPFEHQNGDLVRLWIQSRETDRFLIRDYGETFAMLRLYGVDPNTDARSQRLDYIADQFDLESASGELKLRSTREQLGGRIIDAVQAVLATSHLIYTHQTRQPSRFRTTMENWLSDVGYDYTTGYEVSGSTHSREFDFGINHREPSVLLDTVHSNNKYRLGELVDAVMLNWWEVQDEDYEHGVVIDDENGLYDPDLVERLDENLDYLFKWSQKERITQEIPISAES